MVAASKMRKAQERMRHARPYSDKIRNITANLSQANPEYQLALHAQRRQRRRPSASSSSPPTRACAAA